MFVNVFLTAFDTLLSVASVTQTLLLNFETMNRIFARNLLKLHRLVPAGKRYSQGIVNLNYTEPETVHAITGNGIRVFTEETNNPLACVSLFIMTGSRYENSAYNGINHFIEHMAFKGSSTMTKVDIEDFAKYSGSRLDALTTQEYQRFSVTCTPEWIQNAVVLLCGIACQLELEPCEVEREKEKICWEMQDGDRNYKTIVFENLIQSAFQGTTLGQKVIGSSTNIARFDACMTQTYISSHYRPGRLIFASSGPVQNSCIFSNVCRMLQCMPDNCGESGWCSSRFTSSSIIYRDDSKDFAHVAVAVEAPGFLSEDYIAMRLLKNIIGSWSKGDNAFGAWPELAMRCTKTDICQSFESFYITFGDVGLWGVYFVCGKMDAEDFMYNWQEVVKSMCCTLRDSDYARAKRLTKLELFKERLGAYNSSVSLGKEILYRKRRPPLLEYTGALDILKRVDVQELAYKMLYNAQPVVSAAGPTECLPEYNRLAAGQYWLRW